MGYHSQLKYRFGDWFREKPLPLKVALTTFGLFGYAIVAKILAELHGALALEDWQIAAVLVGITMAGALATMIFRKRRGNTISLPSDIEVQRSFSTDDLKKLRYGLHAEIYGGVSPDGDEIDRMYDKNPRMGVGLRNTKSGKYVAFATAWPLTDAAGQAIVAGTRTENDLTADDILPESENPRATYVLVPAFGATDSEGMWQRSCFGLMLRDEMRKALRQNFFGRNRRRPLKIVAAGFSDGGVEVCRSVGLDTVRHIAFDGSPGPVPIFLGELRREALD